MTEAPERRFVCPVLIGRATQLDGLNKFLLHVLEGEASTVLLSGEAGIGKSRLVAETAAIARAHGFEIIQGSCFEQDRALPYSAVLELLRSCFASRPSDEIEGLIGLLSSEVARVAPELFPGLTPSPVVDPEQEKHRLFYAVAQLLLQLAAKAAASSGHRGPSRTPSGSALRDSVKALAAFSSLQQ